MAVYRWTHLNQFHAKSQYEFENADAAIAVRVSKI